MRYEFQNTRKGPRGNGDAVDVFTITESNLALAVFWATRRLGKDLGALTVKHFGRFVPIKQALREEKKQAGASVKAQIAGLRA